MEAEKTKRRETSAVSCTGYNDPKVAREEMSASSFLLYTIVQWKQYNKEAMKSRNPTASGNK